MGELNLLTIVLAALAFFVIGAVWYGVLFGKVWQREAGLSDEQLKGGNMALIFGLTLAFELLIALVLAHQFAMTGASDRAIMMISIGFGAFVMTPAIGINYLYQRKSGTLFAIDAGHFILGMSAMGGVFALMN
ncbi:DUF1761 domain-containing protein [Erythrobacter sp. SDW2]|uniref:DUF1761 domain-containing protein n=1 Tax=Erythrobacter sp. SDW2 TaxID=2907154 RepID=UPI001F455205|nr:DUF1761 domain-containing protein [Erythrobacter sp. SDW2]UIP06635.1 DUF1761 domain-containing protein [Erythrobacter sp. SDW2]